MSGPRPPHLQRRNGIYHLRMRVPDRLRERIGRQEVCKSLQTYSPNLARSLAATVSAYVLEAFAVLDEITNITPDEARTLIQACFEDGRREIDSLPPFAPDTDFPDEEFSEQVSLAEDCIIRLEGELEHRAPSIGTVKAAETALARRGIDVKLIAPDGRARLLAGFTRLLIEQQRFGLARLRDPLADYHATDPIFGRPIEDATPSAVAAEHQIGLSVRQALDDYLAAKKLVWRNKTYCARVVHLTYLAEHLGADRKISDVSSYDIRGFRNSLTKLRANHGRRRPLTFNERMTENVKATVTNKTARLIFEPAKAFFRWAKEDEGLIAINPAADVRWQSVGGPKILRTRRPFSESELISLFSSPVFRGSKSKFRRYESGSVLVRDAKYWVPIIGYYTGMRLGEIIQLHLSDVVLDSECPHFDLNELSTGGGKKHIKTAAGIRKVPIHPDLCALGLRDLLGARRKRKTPCGRLFSEVPFGSDGQASTEFSKLFARMMDRAGLPDPALTFHSFRHGAEDAFRNANLNQYLIDAIMGHSDGKISSAYGDGPSLQMKYEAVKAMVLPICLPSLFDDDLSASFEGEVL